MRELSRGLAFAGLALLTVLAGLWLALSENPSSPIPPKAPSRAPTETLYVPSPVLPSRTPIDAFALLQTQAPAGTPTACPLPAGWFTGTVASGDTLVGLAATHGVSLAALLQANCLDHDSTFVGAIIYLPLTTPTVAPTPACGPPLGWVFYTVRAGDTLFALSVRYGTTIYELRQANCLPGLSITVGQNLFVPPGFVAPGPSATATIVPSVTATNTQAASATVTTAATVAASATATNPPSATNTATATSPATATASNTATTAAPDTETPTASATSAPTATDVPTATETATTPTP